MAKFSIDTLEKDLGSRAMSAEELQGIAAGIAPLRSFNPRNVFPIGIVDPDAVRVRITVPKDQIGGFLTDMGNVSDAIIRSWRVFPIGIVNPDRFEVDIDIGRPFA